MFGTKYLKTPWNLVISKIIRDWVRTSWMFGFRGCFDLSVSCRSSANTSFVSSLMDVLRRLRFLILWHYAPLLYFLCKHHTVFKCVSLMWFLYPQKLRAKALPMGYIWFSYGLLFCHLWTKFGVSNFALVIHQKSWGKKLYCMGGGWCVGGGCTVDSLGPWIFFYFNFVTRYVMKLLRIAKKYVTNFLMGFKFWDEVGVGDHRFSKVQ